MKFRHIWFLLHGRILRLCAPCGLITLGLLGCSDASTQSGHDAGPTSCPSGQVAGAEGVCMPVGIQGCAEIFVGADGLCHPSIDKCPAGTIPKFNEGCVPVGIPGCAELFMEADGLCHPSIDKCPAGTIPKFNEGCVPVGIPNCAPEFIDADGLCHPSMAKCPAGSFAAPQKGCIPIDGPGGCGTGTWGNLADAPNTIYVDPTYPALDSDGSKAKPVKTISAAMGIVPAGGRIVLAAGLYAEAVVITDTVTLEGRCPSMVRIEGSVNALGQKAVVWVNSAQGVVLRGVEIGGPAVGVIASFAPALTIDRVHIRNASGVGLIATGATTELSLSQSLIEDTLPDGTGQFGYGADMMAGVQATFTDSAFVANRYGGVHVENLNTKLTMTGSLIEGTVAQQSDKGSGRGMNISGNAWVSMTGNALVANRDVGVFATGKETELIAEGNLIEGTLAQESDQRWGSGIDVDIGVKATLTSNAILGNHHGGIEAASAGTELIATGNLVMGTLPEDGSQSYGYGIAVGLGAQATLNENALLANHRVGLSALEPGTDVTAARNLIEGTLPDKLATTGHGIQVRTGARAKLTENALVRNHFTGLYLTEMGTDVTVEDSLIENTLPVDQGGQKWYGLGAVAAGCLATISRTALLENSRLGIALQDVGTDVTLAGNLIKGTRPDESPDGSGWGILAQFSARATLQDNAVVENNQTGIGISGAGTDVTATGTLIERTLSSEKNHDFGLGVQVIKGAHAALSDSALVQNHYLALLIGDLGTTVTVTGDMIEGTLPQESDGEYGGGVLFQSDASLTLTSSVLRDNRGFAVLGYSSAAAGASVTADLSHNWIDGVTANSFTLMDPPMTYTDIGDGILMIRRSAVSLTGNRIEGCARAGVLFESSSGSLSEVTSANNQFGLVLQGSPWPAYESTANSFGPNANQDIVLGGNLALPDKAAPIPPPPAPL